MACGDTLAHASTGAEGSMGVTHSIVLSVVLTSRACASGTHLLSSRSSAPRLDEVGGGETVCVAGGEEEHIVCVCVWLVQVTSRNHSL